MVLTSKKNPNSPDCISFISYLLMYLYGRYGYLRIHTFILFNNKSERIWKEEAVANLK
jgi:hypothetical protein